MATVATSERDVMTLSPGAVRGLVERRTVSPSAVSPLASLLRDGRGVAETPPELGAFRASLEVLARPEAYVRILILRPEGEDEESVGLLARDGQGAGFSLADGALHLGRVQPLASLALSLAGSLVHAGPLAGGEVWLWPSVVQLLTGLWQDQPDAAAPLSRAAVIDTLKTPEFGAAEAETLVDGIVASGAVRRHGDQLVIDPGLAPWLGLLWSGHAVQVEHVPLSADEPLEDAIEGPRAHLLFVGPPGRRVHDEVVAGDALVKHLGGPSPREASMLHLSAPSAEDVARRLRELLRLA